MAEEEAEERGFVMKEGGSEESIEMIYHGPRNQD